MEIKYIFGNVYQKKHLIFIIIIIKKSNRYFFGIVEGRVYVEEGRFNTDDEGKKKLINNDG